MTPGAKLRCVNAPEAGIPITEGQLYTVKRYVAKGGNQFGDGSMPERHGEPGVELVELPGNCFMLSRFEKVAV